MRPYFFEFNDVGLRVARGTDEIVRSPGYATFAHNRVEVGERGHAHAWLAPRHSSNRFWRDLNTAPLTQFGKRIRHAGDLAYLHLEHLRERAGNPDSAIFITPSSYQRAQLSLLLGIAQASGMTVTALVDSAAAVGASLSPGQYVYLEAALHHCTLTRIEVTDHATRQHSEVIASGGMIEFEQKITAAIVDAFLTRCRFDPLHDASTEQLLHTHLAEWLGLLEKRAEIALSIDFHGTRHETRIHRDALIAATAPLAQQIARRTGGERVVIDHRLAAIPGFVAHWAHAQLLSPEAVFSACVNNAELQSPPSDTGISLRSSLPSIGVPRRVPEVEPAPTHGATHLLINHTAHPITTTGLYLAPRGQTSTALQADTVCRVFRDAAGPQIEPLNGAHVSLNGRSLTHVTALTLGDHLTIPGANTLFVPIMVQAADAL